MADFDEESYNACKFFIKNINWFVQRKQQYLETNFRTWTGKNATVYDAFKDCTANMAFGKTDQMVEKYFKYILDKRLVLEIFEKKFLEGKDELEMLFDNTGLEISKLALLETTEESKGAADIAEGVKNLKITSKILIEVLSGTEENPEEWFESFEIKANAVDWTDVVKGIRLPAYLAELALVVWKTQTVTDRVDYKVSKKNILKELLDENTFEQRFYSKKQKECETVLEFYYKLINDASKIFDNEDKKKCNVLKVFWLGLRFEIRRMVVGSGNPSTIEIALEVAKSAEKFLKENQEQQEKLIAVVENKSPVRDSRRWDQKGETSRRDRSKSPDRNLNRGNRSSTPFRKEGPFRCFKCDEEGHMARECTKERRRRCFYCGKEGHLIEKCYAKSKDEANAKPVKD